VPGDEKLVNVVGVAQYAAGGVVHVTPAHGSALQLPAEHPCAQVVSVGAYEQEPPEQVPADA
jgi:hypothetical protein